MRGVGANFFGGGTGKQSEQLGTEGKKFAIVHVAFTRP